MHIQVRVSMKLKQDEKITFSLIGQKNEVSGEEKEILFEREI